MSALADLAEIIGIEPGYADLQGTWHTTSDETRRMFLTALGLPADSEEAARSSLTALTTRRWSRVTEPVVVVASEAQPGAVSVCLPDDGRNHDLRWTLTLEDGSVLYGQRGTAGLEILDRYAMEGLGVIRFSLPLPDSLPEGYHRVAVTAEGVALPPSCCAVIVAPPTCWSVAEAVPDERPWGIACQLYSLRSRRDWGIGTYGDLAEFCRSAATAGADLIGLNPLHALSLADPSQASPYSPMSRSFLNVIYLDIEAIPDFAESDEARALVADPAFVDGCRQASARDLIDYPAVVALRLPVLKACHASFRQRHVDAVSDRAQSFHAFCAAQGRRLHDFAVFLALQEHLGTTDPKHLDWRTWPEAYRDPNGAAVRAFVEENGDAVAFQCYLQWLADQQLGHAAEAARLAGMRIGLYTDIAIGVGPASFEAWREPEVLVTGVSVGAPPDPFAPLGQNWGLSPPNPLALRDQAFEPFILSLRANMRHSGALRLDHVMGMMHLFWIPLDATADHGAYVSYPLDELLRILALESRRHRCLVIGEDLGTVPEHLRPLLRGYGVLSYRVLLFERFESGLFKQPDDYPETALVTPGTHDLPTLAGYWAGRDLDWRERLGQIPRGTNGESLRAERRLDQRRLIDALIYGGLLPAGNQASDGPEPSLSPDVLIAIYGFLAATPSQLMMVALEDLIGQVEQMNLPGTIDEHPNWRRRMPLNTAEIVSDETAAAVLAAAAAGRRAHLPE